MKNRFKFYISLVVLGIATVIFTYTLISAITYSSESEISVPDSNAGQIVQIPNLPEIPEGEKPSRLLIPILGVDTKVQHVGVAKSGNMATPTNFTDVGWYKYGAAPGRNGSAVMAGHVDNALALAGVFKRLGNLRPGDDVIVTTEKGTNIRFAVTDVSSYDYDKVPTEEIFNQTGKAYLKLITCTGSWIQKNKTYNQRLVVTAVREE